MSKLTLERAKEILPKHTTEHHLFIHAACVSAAMGAMADYFGEDKDHWEAIGWLHDVDYEKYPSTEEHCHHVRELLEPEGVDEEDIRSIISHGYGITTNEVEPTTNLEKSLFTVDELTGIIHAYGLMRPEGMDGMKVFNTAIENNVAFVPGTHFYTDGGHLNTLRLNFSMSDIPTINEGMARLGEVIRG